MNIHPHHFYLSTEHSLGIILGCLLILMICKYRHVPTYHRELTVGGFLGMVIGIPLAMIKFIIRRYYSKL